MSEERIKSFAEFYPFYQAQHRRWGTRVLHVMGTGSFLGLTCLAALKRSTRILPLGVLAGYGCAWLGHFFVEHNRPATFKYPWWSLLADFKMLFGILLGREQLQGPAAGAAAP